MGGGRWSATLHAQPPSTPGHWFFLLPQSERSRSCSLRNTQSNLKVLSIDLRLKHLDFACCAPGNYQNFSFPTIPCKYQPCHGTSALLEASRSLYLTANQTLAFSFWTVKIVGLIGHDRTQKKKKIHKWLEQWDSKWKMCSLSHSSCTVVKNVPSTKPRHIKLSKPIVLIPPLCTLYNIFVWTKKTCQTHTMPISGVRGKIGMKPSENSV
jgi:hypothetical protein